MRIVAVAVVVVVFKVGAVRLLLVGPDIVLQVGVVDVHTSVENGNHWSLGISQGHIPQRRQIDGGRCPLLAVERLAHIGGRIGSRTVSRDKCQVVGLSILHLAHFLEHLHSFVNMLHLGGIETQAIELAQVRFFHHSAIGGFRTPRLSRGDGARERHQFFSFSHAESVHHKVNGTHGRSLELALHLLHTHTVASLEFHNHLPLAIGSEASLPCGLVHTILIVVAHHLGKRWRSHQQHLCRQQQSLNSPHRKHIHFLLTISVSHVPIETGSVMVW